MAASNTLLGSSTLSPLPSRATIRHVDGITCIGPTARSKTASPSSSPRSVSGTKAVPLLPSRGTPMIGGEIVEIRDRTSEPLGRVAPGSRVVLDRSVPHPAHGRQQLPPPGQVGRVLGAQQVVDRRARATVDVRRDRQLAQPLTGRSQLL